MFRLELVLIADCPFTCSHRCIRAHSLYAHGRQI